MRKKAVAGLVGFFALFFGCRNEMEESAKANQERFEQQSRIPGTPEYEKKQAAEAQRKADEEQKAAEAIEAATPMKLREAPRPRDVVGLPRVKVRAALGTSMVPDGNFDQLKLDTTELLVQYANGRASEYTIVPKHYSQKRDEPSLLAWLALPSANPIKLNGVAVAVSKTAAGVIIYNIEARNAEQT